MFKVEKIRRFLGVGSIFYPVVFIFCSSAHAVKSKIYKTEIYFVLGQSKVLKTEGEELFNRLHKTVENSPGMKIFITGHTDNSGPRRLNKGLSEERAGFISKKLISRGLSSKNIFLKGVGERFPVWSNKNKIGRAKNRSVVVVVVANSKKDFNETPDETFEKALSKNLNEDSTEKTISSLPYRPFLKDKKSAGGNKNKIEEEREEGLAPEALKKSDVESDYATLRYSLLAGGGQSLLNVGHNTNSSLSSDWKSSQNYFAGGVFQVQASKYWVGFKFLGLVQDYKLKGSPPFTWNEEVPFLIRGALITDYETKSWGLGLDFDFNQEIFAIEESGAIKLVDEMLPGLTVRGKYKWFDRKVYSSRLHFSLSLPFSGNGDLGSKGKLGYVVSADIRRARALWGHGLVLKIYYGLRKFENLQSDQEEEVLGVQLSLDSALWL